MPRFTTWHFECGTCDSKESRLCWDYELPQPCSTCGHAMYMQSFKLDKAPTVIGDELINYAAKHAVCNPDGTPRRFDSKTELKQALNEAGFTIYGDTPKPYSVRWSGKVKEPEKVATIYKVKNAETE